MEGIEAKDPVGPSRGVAMSAWRQVAVFLVAAVSVVVFVRLGKYLGQRFNISQPLTAAALPIVPTVGAALIAKKVLTPGAKVEEKKPSNIDWIDNFDGVTRYAEWTGDETICNQLTVRLPVKQGVGPIYASDEDIEIAAQHLLKESKLEDYVVADEKTIHVIKLVEKHSSELTFTLQGYKPANLEEARELVKSAWPLNVSSGSGTAVSFHEGDSAYLWVSLPAKAKDAEIKRVARNMVLKAANESYTPSEEQKIKQDKQGEGGRLVFNIRGFQPRTEAEAEAILRRAIAGATR